jgi:hypothetical protein
MFTSDRSVFAPPDNLQRACQQLSVLLKGLIQLKSMAVFISAPVAPLYSRAASCLLNGRRLGCVLKYWAARREPVQLAANCRDQGDRTSYLR